MTELMPECDFPLQPDESHRAAWRYLNEHTHAYPAGLHVPPMKPGTDTRPGPTWAGAEITTEQRTGEPNDVAVGIAVSVGGDLQLLEDLDTPDGPERLASLLFTHRRRGAAYVFAHGGTHDLHLVVRQCRRAWVAAGYELSPAVRGTYITSITVRKSGHSWHLADLRAVTGLEQLQPDDILSAFAGPAFARASQAARTAVAVGVFTSIVEEYFGVRARLTAGRTTVSALQRHVPADNWIWRPSALAATLSRSGGGFRGGYCYYPAYRGGGHKLDLRRAYGWALRQELPNGSSYGRCVGSGAEQRGLFVCTVRGPGHVPVLLAPFTGQQSGFVTRLWNGPECVCVLPQAEFAGLRALGFGVVPGWGAVTRRTVSFRTFIDQVERLGAEHGWDSPIGLVGKAVMVRAYGKLAENPHRAGVTFAEGPPSSDCLPLMDAAGEEVDGGWWENLTAYRAHQHVDVAAEITALVRSRVYRTMARLDDHRVTVLAVDTDGIVTRNDPREAIPFDAEHAGGWRYTGYDPDIVIAGPRFAAIDGRVLVAGTSPQPREVVVLAHDRGVVSVEGKVMAPPWSGEPMHGTVRKELRRGGGVVA